MRPECEIFSDRRSPAGRKILDEIEIPFARGPEPHVRAWLAEALSSLNLPAGFSERILESAGEALLQRGACGGAQAAPRGHLHLIISIPERADGEAETWGFFRIEKLEAAEGTAPGHSIEFYLYVEGD
jgi:hypothetical protein